MADDYLFLSIVSQIQFDLLSLSLSLSFIFTLCFAHFVLFLYMLTSEWEVALERMYIHLMSDLKYVPLTFTSPLCPLCYHMYLSYT